MCSLRRRDNPSTYFVQDRKNEKELTRLMIQDRLIIALMGGVLPEQPDPTAFHRVLDVRCGTGGWVIEAAQTYPEMSLVGLDASQRMIKYARTQANAHHLDDRVEFHVVDVLGPLDFPAAYFDLVNLQFGVSFVRTWEWPKLLSELLRVTRPGGVIRLTEAEVIQRSNSPALTRLLEMLQLALFRAGRLFTEESAGLTSHLVRLLDQHGCQQIQTKAYVIEYQTGTPEWKAMCEDLKLLFRTVQPFIQKWGSATPDYEVIYRQALKEMSQPDFLIVADFLTAWGSKP
jgi:ubiquinone/menaquinone biosynthesis C-methylase UbiE